jgi:LmbE family N-acetylglucosaminyl deacetylase
MTEIVRPRGRALGADELDEMDDLVLLCVVAHPDDETLGFGGTLARYAAEGVATVVVSARRGERCWQSDPAADPGPAALGSLREAELRDAAAELGLAEVAFLGYTDGELDRAAQAEAVARVVDHIRRVRPRSC